MTTIKTYSELIRIPTFKERYNYLRIGGQVGKETFGYDRYVNQILYTCNEWKRFRRDIIFRDKGCDLACDGFEIYGRILIHHIDPENVICTSLNTHNAIHYGDESILVLGPIERKPNDTCPWK